MTIQAYLIGGPNHGDIRMLDDGHHPDLRIACPPQMSQWRGNDPWEPRMKTGIYKRTQPLMFDPINHRVEFNPTCYIFEWMGWEP